MAIMSSEKHKGKWFEKNFRKKDSAEKKPIVVRRVGRPTEWTEEKIGEETEALKEWIQNPDNYYFTGFLVERSLTPEHIARFSQVSKEFCETFAIAQQVQEQRLVEHALTKEHDGNFTKFVLANRAGWKERTELSGNSASPLSFILSSIDSKTKDITIDTSAITDQSVDE